ncbi:DUF1289 domain-containing protein [Marinomonas ostreistagni]|uniref:DUF1289 domain-containing protein n=1 Tax=Marinomonas ostreistagni TaxID=359209 RepID=UPI0019503D0F|nr:DUF1289 domain-containing protein [Marinomonas ostreistagni]MBM6551104.1 DUF1289 domain-containing protein [Marinomonas ostreistagni]
MEQIELFQVESPCRGICESSSKGYCKGCLRSRDERFHWHEMSDAQKRQVIQLCRSRWQRILRARQERLQHSDKPMPYGMEGEAMQDLFATPATLDND